MVHVLREALLIPCQLVLHPRHKLSYFKMAGWEQEWIETAKELVRDAFELSYKQEDARDQDEPPVAKSITGTKVRTRWCEVIPCVTGRFQSSAPPNMFDSLPSLSAPKRYELRDELGRYLSTDPEAVNDVLMWWHGRRAMYPYLSRMALDYLTIPGMFSHSFNISETVSSNSTLPATSVDIKRIFSRGRLILSHVRSRLSAQSTRALLCLRSWSSLGLVKDTDVLAVTVLDDVKGDEEYDLEDGWDHI